MHEAYIQSSPLPPPAATAPLQIFSQVKASQPSGELMKLTFNGKGAAMGSIYMEESPFGDNNTG